ncbi:MAG TPA: protein-glutamate O-methyltransferase CheR [Kofleriaceae bacterium]|jgi:chemotaxis protein methyltransferase CheR
MKPTGDELARFAGAVAAQLGLRLDPERAVEVVERRAAAHREPICAYLDRVAASNPAELDAVARELVIGETYFLRHLEQFRAFAELAAPERLARGRLRVLSAGCSSGEEPYTLAMLLRESWPGAAFTIRAIDLDARAIARARAGRYSRWSLRATTPVFEQRWFRRDGAELVVAPEIRDAVTFERANLLDDAELDGSGRWDVVFCRNVLMYFTEEQAAAVIARFARSLTPGGYLFLGHAETLRGCDDFALCHSHGAFYYRRLPVLPAVGFALPPAPAQASPQRGAALDTGWIHDIHAATRRVHDMVDGALDRASGARQAEAPAAALDLEPIRELLARERFDEALDQLDQLRAETAGDREVVMLRALVLTHSGRFAEARVACAALLAVDGASAGASYLLALCCDSTGDTDGAARMAEAAAVLDPSFAMPRVHLGLLARRTGAREIASRELTRAIELLEHEAPARLALYGGGFSRQALLGVCRAELAAIGALP